MKRLFFLLSFCFFLIACGDVGVSPNGYHFNARFYYYYSSYCDYDFEPYNCSDISSISPSFIVSLKVDYDGYATLTIDGKRFFYNPSEYSTGIDRFQYYYQFYDGYEEITVFEDGTEMIYLDKLNGYAIYYYSDLYY